MSDPSNNMEVIKQFSRISGDTIGAFQRDKEEGVIEPESLLLQLTKVNPRLALYIIAEAREAKAIKTDPETAYVNGALSMVGVIIKSLELKQLEQRLFGAQNESISPGDGLNDGASTEQHEV